MGDHEATARRALEIFNSGDLAAYADILTPDAVYEETGSGVRTTGLDAFLAVCKVWKAGLPDAKGTVTKAISCGDSVVLEISWEGNHTGDLVTGMGTIPATGKHTATRAVEVIDFEGDKIRATRHYLDLVTFMAQIGMGVPSGAPA